MFSAAVNLSHEFSSGFNQGSPAGTVRLSRIMNEALNVSLKPPPDFFCYKIRRLFFINGLERWGEKAESERSETLTPKQGRFGMPACILSELYFCLLCLVYSLKDSLAPNLGKTLCTGRVAPVEGLATDLPPRGTEAGRPRGSCPHPELKAFHFSGAVSAA